jgi:hypothetical protein
MPSRSKILAASDVDEEEEEGESPVDKRKQDVFGSWGWRSDDAAFKGGMVKGIRTVSASGYAATDDDSVSVPDTGARSFFRRASENIPMPTMSFRRPEPYAQPHPHPHPHPQSGAGALSPSGSPCPPALDETPVIAKSVARVEKDYSGGLAHRLEQSLSASASARSDGEGLR